MSRERFQSTDMNSLYGQFLYDRVVSKGHFLRRLREVVPWQRFTYKLVKYYRGKAQQGRPPYDPSILLRMLLLAYLYDLSESEVERFCQESMPAKYFLGIAVDALVPDHSTLTVFKNRILENGKLRAYTKLLNDIVHIAQESGVVFGSLQIIDSTHTIANVNVQKDDHRQKKGERPRDPSAQWGVKHARTVRDENGKKRKVPEYFYGYKMHTSFNAEAQMITSVVVSPGQRYDGHYLPSLIESDVAQGLPIEVCTADRGYDDTDNHFFLQSQGIRSAIHLNDYRTQKKDPNKQVWFELKAQPWYKPSLHQRYQIERKFGEAKQYHGLGRCRYLGIWRYGIQAYLTAIALNWLRHVCDLKRMVRLLTGVPFKGKVPVMV